MNKKFLIIAISVLLIISLGFGLSFKEAFEFFNSQTTILVDLAEAVAEISGGDTNSDIPLFIPELNNADLGTYYSEETELLYNVRNNVKKYLPTWLQVADPALVSIKVFPTYYSFKIYYVKSSTNINVGGDPLGNLAPNGSEIQVQNLRFSIQRSIRFYVTFINPYTQTPVTYDLYLFYDYHNQKYAWFCTKANGVTGIYSNTLDLYSQVKVNVQYNHNSGLLNSSNAKYILPQDDGNNFLYYYITDYTNTTDPLWLYYNEFLKE